MKKIVRTSGVVEVNNGIEKSKEQETKSTTVDAMKAPATESASKSASLWLILWMVNNIGVTLLNKASFQKVNFKHPYFLTFIHMACNGLGSQFVLSSIRRDQNRLMLLREENLPAKVGFFQRLLGDITFSELKNHEKQKIFLFSIVFSLNIAIGNVSLRHVSVNFNQVMRSLVPAITIVMGMAMGKSFTTNRKLSVLPVICGVAMACFGDMSYTRLGLLYTVACILLAALKVVAAGEMLTGTLKLHPVDLLGYMAPLAMMQCLFLSFITGELKEVLAKINAFMWSPEYSDTSISLFDKYFTVIVVLASGVSSFSLNICSLMTNKLTSPLTLCIAANVKQVLMIAMSTVIFNVVISPLNGAGIIVVLLGSALYSYVALMEKLSSKTAASGITDDKTDKENDRDVEGGKSLQK